MIQITYKTAMALIDDRLPHAAEYSPGELTFDGVKFEVLPDSEGYRKRLRAYLMPWRYWK